ncbi:MAG: DUF1186 domain-containing protein [Rhodoferax sp.]|nr:DUF1186 domain-containing protein [Rhodoferax sp.]MDP3654178.1 DUF1186 domain-containing protein [Rhodoferax sp.]
MTDPWNTLLPQIEYFSKPFPRAAIAFANAHREEVAPHLIAALAHMAADPSMAEDPEYVLHLYAMHLLAAWRDTRAYAPMVALGRHDDDTLDMVMGDTLTESYGRCLASVCDGDIQPLQALFEDTQVSHWVRNAALDAIMVRVFEGDGSRDELVQYLMARGDAEAQRLRLPGTSVGELEVINCIASVASDIGAVEMRGRVEGWYDERLLDPMIADKAWFVEHLGESFDVCLDRELSRGKGYVQDVEKEIGWWAGFRDVPAKKPAPKVLPSPVPGSRKIGRNDPCPCGSGKKYKKCHGMG